MFFFFFLLSRRIYIVPGMGQGEILRTIKPAHPTEALRCPPLRCAARRYRAEPEPKLSPRPLSRIYKI